jgi:hypothetical protein
MNLIHYIGLDVHNDSIAISIAANDSAEVRRWGIIGGTHEHVQRLLKQLQSAHPEATLKFCYEAGPRGLARPEMHRQFFVREVLVIAKQQQGWRLI